LRIVANKLYSVFQLTSCAKSWNRSYSKDISI
jgi:hypothetical protein